MWFIHSLMADSSCTLAHPDIYYSVLRVKCLGEQVDNGPGSGIVLPAGATKTEEAVVEYTERSRVVECDGTLYGDYTLVGIPPEMV